jgi:hypothetical protein
MPVMRHLCSKPRSPNRIQQYNVVAPFKRIITDRTGPFQESERGNQYLLIAMGYYTKWTKVYTIPNQETSMADVLVTSSSYASGFWKKCTVNRSQNFTSQLTQKVFQHLGISKIWTTHLHPQSDDMVERYVKTVEKHLRTVNLTNQKDWNDRLPIFLLAYRAPTHKATCQPACCLGDCYTGVPPNKKQCRLTVWQTSWIGCMISMIMHVNI